MILGPITFPALAIEACTPSHAWQYAPHAVIEGPERRQFVARAADSYAMTLFLHAEFIAVQDTIDRLKELADEHEVLTLQELGGRVLGDYVIESFGPTPIFKLEDGTLLCARAELKLVDPGLERAVVPPKAIAVVGTSSPTTTTSPEEDRSTPPGSITSRKIVRLP